MDAVDHQRDQVQSGEVSGEQVGQGGLGHRHELARHRGLARRLRLCGDVVSDRLQRDRVAAGRHPGQHRLHRHPPEQLGAVEHLVGGHRHLTAAIDRTDPGPGDRNAATTEPATDPSSVPCRVAVRSGSCLPRGPHAAVTSPERGQSTRRLPSPARPCPPQPSMAW